MTAPTKATNTVGTSPPPAETPRARKIQPPRRSRPDREPYPRSARTLHPSSRTRPASRRAIPRPPTRRTFGHPGPFLLLREAGGLRLTLAILLDSIDIS